MKKIIIAFDGDHFSKGAFNFAKRLNELQPLLLVGVMLPEFNYGGVWNLVGANGELYYQPEDGHDQEAVEQNAAHFEALCRTHGIEYRIHKGLRDFAEDELQRETRFADLMILGSEMFYEQLGTEEMNMNLRKALHISECPVIVVPEEFQFPESLVLTYDGSASSVYAIRQFSYLFPEFRNLPALVVYASASSSAIPDQSYLEELAARHYDDLSLYLLETQPKTYFATWVSERKNTMLVTGAFGRSSLSETLRRSFVAQVITDHKLPVFVGHR